MNRFLQRVGVKTHSLVLEVIETAGKIETAAFEIGDKIASEQDMFLVDVQLKREGGKQFLRLFIDKEGGMGIDGCEAFSRAFEEEFDKNDPIETEYTLEVSSPGVDRQLRTEREFEYYTGREVDVKLYKALDGVKEFTGCLMSYEDNEAEIKCEEKIIKINKKEAAYIKLHFEF